MSGECGVGLTELCLDLDLAGLQLQLSAAEVVDLCGDRLKLHVEATQLIEDVALFRSGLLDCFSGIFCHAEGSGGQPRVLGSTEQGEQQDQATPFRKRRTAMVAASTPRMTPASASSATYSTGTNDSSPAISSWRVS